MTFTQGIPTLAGLANGSALPIPPSALPDAHAGGDDFLMGCFPWVFFGSNFGRDHVKTLGKFGDLMGFNGMEHGDLMVI